MLKITLPVRTRRAGKTIVPSMPIFRRNRNFRKPAFSVAELTGAQAVEWLNSDKFRDRRDVSSHISSLIGVHLVNL